MQTFGLTLTLQDDPHKIPSYKRFHQAVWPRVTDRLRECWNALMADLQARAPEASADEWWAAMDLVFDLDWPQHQPASR
jgi:L-rhamnose mutarotase